VRRGGGQLPCAADVVSLLGGMAAEHEEKIAHLERIVDELSAVVARQDRDIARLTKLVDLLAERERGREGDGGVILGDERPPHY